MKFHYALVALALAACNGDASDKTGVTGDTADTDTDTGPTNTDCPNGEFTGTPSITSAMVSCTEPTATVHVTTEGVAAGGSVFFQETGNTGTAQWTENHDLTQVAADPCGFTSDLEVTLAASTPYDQVEENVSSLFTCEQLEDNTYMSFAFFALDGTGAVIDCYAFGGDVAGMTGNEHDIVNDPLYPTELAGCEEGTEGM